MGTMAFTKQLIRVLVALGFTGGVALAANAVNCGDAIGPNKTVTLTADLTCSTNPALTVIGPATLNMNGHTVSCIQPDTIGLDGIVLEGEGAVLKNGEVKDCANSGVSLRGVGRHKVTQVSFRVGGGVGFIGNGVGFDVQSDANQCVHCMATNPHTWGFYLFPGSDDNTFLFSQAIGSGFEGNAGGGFGVDGGNRNRFISCIATGNLADGFAVFAGQENSFILSSATGNGIGFGFNGFFIYALAGKTSLKGVVANKNGHSGIVVESDHHTLTGVIANNNPGHGVWLAASADNNRVVGAKAHGNGDLDLRDDTNCTTNVWVGTVAGTKSDCIP
jgi:hypothetical protein